MDRARWEMCVVSTDAADAYVEYWEGNGPERKALAGEGGPVGTGVRVRRVLAQLGDNGWELTGVAGTLLYFKRAKM